MNLETARMQMIGQQVRAWDVFDTHVLEALRDTPREAFVPPAYSGLAFADMEIPLDHDQSMLAPKIEGRLLQALALDSNMRVLDVGTGTGYLAACLARLAGEVLSIDIFSDFTTAAKTRGEELGIDNACFCTQDALEFNAEAEFDAIAVTASVPQLDDHFIRMLRPGGRLFVVVGREPAMEARLITMGTTGQWLEEGLFETVLTPMVNAEHPEPFVL